MKTNIVNRIALKIKLLVEKLKQRRNTVLVSNDNGFNESYEDIINENIYNERLEAALAKMLAESPACQAQTITLQVSDGVSVSFFSGCQVAQAQVLWKQQERDDSDGVEGAPAPLGLLENNNKDEDSG